MNIFEQRKRRKVLFSLLLATFLYIGTTSAGGSNIPTEVQDYASALREFEKQPKRKAIEPVYALGMAAANKLTGRVAGDNPVSVLESLNPADYGLVEDQMKGFTVTRHEMIAVVPDVVFLRNLAKQKGQDVDIAFFNLLDQTTPHSFWPIYVEQLSDIEGCLKYGTGLLVEFYGKWKEFQRSYPLSYKADVERILADIEGYLSFGSRSCGATTDVVSEMELFIKSYPESDVSREIRQRIKKMKMDQSNQSK